MAGFASSAPTTTDLVAKTAMKSTNEREGEREGAGGGNRELDTVKRTERKGERERDTKRERERSRGKERKEFWSKLKNNGCRTELERIGRVCVLHLRKV